MDQLVQQLAEGDHPVMAGSPQPSLEQLQQSIERDYVHIKFTDTRGGTDLGMRLDKDASDLSAAGFAQGTGTVHLVGSLTLNYVRVRCVADLDLATLRGTGHLEILEQLEQ
jgi:hypothetical protein